MINDRVRFNEADWTAMLQPAFIHSSTKLTPAERSPQ